MPNVNYVLNKEIKETLSLLDSAFDNDYIRVNKEIKETLDLLDSAFVIGYIGKCHSCSGEMKIGMLKALANDYVCRFCLGRNESFGERERILTQNIFLVLNELWVKDNPRYEKLREQAFKYYEHTKKISTVFHWIMLSVKFKSFRDYAKKVDHMMDYTDTLYTKATDTLVPLDEVYELHQSGNKTDNINDVCGPLYIPYLLCLSESVCPVSEDSYIIELFPVNMTPFLYDYIRQGYELVYGKTSPKHTAFFPYTYSGYINLIA